MNDLAAGHVRKVLECMHNLVCKIGARLLASLRVIRICVMGSHRK